MSRTTLQIELSDPALDNWGQFDARKTYRVIPPMTGYVIQTVERSIDAGTADGRRLTTADDVYAFTNRQVQHATGLYSEVFPIRNGTTCFGRETRDRKNCIDDQFSSGAILHYELDEGDGLWHADDEPPTSGAIRMVGRNRFFPSDDETVRRIVEAIRSGDGTRVLRLQDVEWTLNPATPANGLPYNDTYRVLPEDTDATHLFEIRWNPTGMTAVIENRAVPRGGRRKTYRKKKLRKYTRKSRK